MFVRFIPTARFGSEVRAYDAVDVDGARICVVYKTSAGKWRATGTRGAYATRRDAVQAALDQRARLGASSAASARRYQATADDAAEYAAAEAAQMERAAFR